MLLRDSHCWHGSVLEIQVSLCPFFRSQDGSLQCPTCKTIYGVKTGTQPPGKMEYHIIPHALPGHADCKTIRIIYNIPPGVQVGLGALLVGLVTLVTAVSPPGLATARAVTQELLVHKDVVGNLGCICMKVLSLFAWWQGVWWPLVPTKACDAALFPEHPFELQKGFLLPIPIFQGPEHPNPGKSFTARGFPRHCYLPDSEKGRKVSWPRRARVGKVNVA